MVITTKILRIEQPQAAFLAGAHKVLVALVREDGRRCLHVQIALEEPVHIGWRIILFELKELRLRILFYADEAVAKQPFLGSPDAIAGSCIDRSIGADRSAAISPHTAGTRRIDRRRLRREIVSVQIIRIPAAGLSGDRVDHSIR